MCFLSFFKLPLIFCHQIYIFDLWNKLKCLRLTSNCRQCDQKFLFNSKYLVWKAEKVYFPIIMFAFLHNFSFFNILSPQFYKKKINKKFIKWSGHSNCRQFWCGQTCAKGHRSRCSLEIRPQLPNREEKSRPFKCLKGLFVPISCFKVTFM